MLGRGHHSPDRRAPPESNTGEPMNSARGRRGRLIAVPIALSATLLAGCGGPASTDVAVTVARGNCGGMWSVPSVRPTTFQVQNVGTVATSVDLIDPTSGGL